MATANELVTRAVVSASQTLLRMTQPTLVVDGVWGPRTDAAYRQAPDHVRVMVDAGLEKAKLKPEVKVAAVLRPPSGSSHRSEAMVNLNKIADYAISQGITGASLVNFLTTLRAESGFVSRRESHVYRDADAARKTFSALRSMSDAQIRDLVDSGAESFFNTVYGPQTRKGKELGNKVAGDGYAFRGNGLIQITGRANHETLARDTGLPVVANPDLLSQDPDAALAAAVWYWKKFVVARKADHDIVLATRIVNPGLRDIAPRVGMSRTFSNYA